jgi:hypothetical protein
MARGIYKGRPHGAVLTERLRIEGRYRMSAREIFDERKAVHAARMARAAVAKKGGKS